jgi:hypothetical protein|tara:strand:+ start:12416 stop:12856 length:441 start_codon:yes stop_codon:yes gene_type:complete
MLVKVLPNQVCDHWDVVSYGIQQSLPPITIESPRRMNNILESLLLGRMVLWIGVEDNKVQGLLVTAFSYDKNSDVQDLLIYSIYGFEDLSTKLVVDGMDTLKKFAVSNGCKRITAYSKIKAVIDMMKRFGSEEYSYLSIPANGEIK